MKENMCADCGKRLLSVNAKSGLCGDCQYQHMADNAKQLKEKKGPYYERWKAGVKAHAKRLMLEE